MCYNDRMSDIEFQHIHHQFDSIDPLFSDLNFTLKRGQWTSLLGRSGAGKSTLLQLIAGLHPEYSSPVKGQVAYMAQEDGLLPWLTTLDNALLHQRLTNRRLMTKGDRYTQREKAIQWLNAFGLSKQLHARPDQLSGGMRQRVALARTLLCDQAIILMDEPFSKLDAVTRRQLQDLAHTALKDRTVLLVTHDPLEALRLSDTIHVLRGQPASLSQSIQPQGLAPRVMDTTLAKQHHDILESLVAS